MRERASQSEAPVAGHGRDSGAQKAPLGMRAVKVMSLFALALIAAASATVLWWAWSRDARSNTLAFESAKTAMQVIAVAFFGSLAAIATFSFNESRIQETKNHEREIERKTRERDRDHDLRIEGWRRDTENRRDERQRHDELLRSTLDTTVSVYNRVKAERRILKAATRTSGGARVTLDIYEKHMLILNDRQLEFEQLKKLAPRVARPSLGSPRMREVLERGYVNIEEYLNGVIKEYEDKRHEVAADLTVGYSLDKLPELAAFLRRESFSLEVSAHVDVIVDVLHSALLEPLVLSDPEGGDAPQGYEG
jgi:hypothetical protein